MSDGMTDHAERIAAVITAEFHPWKPHPEHLERLAAKLERALDVALGADFARLMAWLDDAPEPPTAHEAFCAALEADDD